MCRCERSVLGRDMGGMFDSGYVSVFVLFLCVGVVTYIHFVSLGSSNFTVTPLRRSMLMALRVISEGEGGLLIFGCRWRVGRVEARFMYEFDNSKLVHPAVHCVCEPSTHTIGYLPQNQF